MFAHVYICVIYVLYSSSIKLIDINTGRKKKLDIKLPGGITGLVYSQCGCYLTVCISDSQEILVFDIQASSSTSEPLCVISTVGVPAGIHIRSTDTYVEVLCWYIYTDAILVRIDLSSASSGADADNNDSSSDSNSGSNIYTCNISTKGLVLGGCLGTPSQIGSSGLTLVTGLQSTPSFQHLSYDSTTVSLPAELHLTSPTGVNGFTSGHNSDLYPTSSSSSSKSKIDSNSNTIDTTAATVNATTILGPHESGGKKRLIASFATSETDDISGSGAAETLKPNKKSKKVSIDENSIHDDDDDDNYNNNNNDTIITRNNNNNSNMIELTIEQRLDMLSAVSTDLERRNNITQQKQQQHIHSSSTTTSTSTKGQTGTSILPQSNSLVVLLEQALQSRDDTLLEQCLEYQDIHVIENTCLHLPTVRVLPLLIRLTGKLEKRPSRGNLLTIWLNNLLKVHASYLVSFPGIHKQLASLSQMLEQRVSTYNKLSSLSGRLDLIMYQTTTTSSSSSSSTTGNKSSSGSGSGSGGSSGSGGRGNNSTNQAEIQPDIIYEEE